MTMTVSGRTYDILFVTALFLSIAYGQNECLQNNRQDCYSAPVNNANMNQCIADGCIWCSNVTSGPVCVQAAVCSSNITKYDCFATPTNNANAAVCQGFGCLWCPTSDIKCIFNAPTHPQCTASSVVSCNSSRTFDRQQCNAEPNCAYCPTSVPGRPTCIDTNPICPPTSSVNDCFQSPTAGVTESSCGNFGCTWCPNTNASMPWCIHDQQVNAACSATSVVDCFTQPTSGVNRTVCEAMIGCAYCPTFTPGRPHCIRVAATNHCNNASRVDCYWSATSGVNQETCETGTQCAWCPNPTNPSDPWCIEDCPPGMTLRYRQRDSCCLGSSSRIVGGQQSQLGRWPWIGALFDNGAHICGAVLVAQDKVLTAAHCLDGLAPSSLTVKFGIVSLNDPTATAIQVINFTIHQSYIPGRFDQDVAILTISSVSFTSNIQVANMPRSENVPNNTKCFVAGWGRTSSGGPTSNELLEVEVDIIPFAQCSTAYTNLTTATLNSIENVCAGKQPNGGADSCQGDSGGPLMCQRCNSCDWYIAGIVSFGEGCGNPNKPGVYSKGTWWETWLGSQGVSPVPTGIFNCTSI